VRGAVDAQGGQVHLLAAATHRDKLLLGQGRAGAKSNEIPNVRPLLDRLALARVGLSSTVITVGAAHPAQPRQLPALPGRGVPVSARAVWVWAVSVSTATAGSRPLRWSRVVYGGYDGS
jgi:hypothetical protein